MLTHRDCPEFSGVAVVEALGLAAGSLAGATTTRTQFTGDGEVVRQRAEIRGHRSEEGYGFVLHDAGGEMVMPTNCPEIGRGAAGEKLKAES